MKFTIEVDYTPEEARHFFGLPEVKPMQRRRRGSDDPRMEPSHRDHSFWGFRDIRLGAAG